MVTWFAAQQTRIYKDDEIYNNSNLIILGQHDPHAIDQNKDKLDNELKRVWEIEETGVKSQLKEKHIEDENQADELENFAKDIRFEGDRYQAKLQWIETDNMPPLMGNYDLCNRRLNSLMFRLKKDPKLLKQYDDVFYGTIIYRNNRASGRIRI